MLLPLPALADKGNCVIDDWFPKFDLHCITVAVFFLALLSLSNAQEQ